LATEEENYPKNTWRKMWTVDLEWPTGGENGEQQYKTELGRQGKEDVRGLCYIESNNALVE